MFGMNINADFFSLGMILNDAYIDFVMDRRASEATELVVTAINISQEENQ